MNDSYFDELLSVDSALHGEDLDDTLPHKERMRRIRQLLNLERILLGVLKLYTREDI